ncbi:MAG: hybrid sensor histidine kinase/response regulator [Candidatus Omnitrophica bacterium]|nr:hybrid sensor histidine kinase/response regulator [Candidatus Omnitrophota bacterium]
MPIVVLTGSYEDESIGIRAVQLGAQDYLVKGEIEGKILPRVIRYAVERHRFREELELRVAERTTQLEDLNKELERFTYSVSHDLRTPLRSMTGFSEALLEDYGSRLDAQGKDYLQRLSAESQRMDKLINDLLNLSRLNRGEIRRERVNLSAAAREIVGRLKEMQPDRRVSLFISDGITAHGDPTLLRLVLENLLGNAWKFTGKRPGAKIVFGATRQEGKTIYFVRDDGAGFDPAYSGKLFTAFQRLHNEAEFPGTGIGLATVQRIIRRHGGLIWAEGKVGKGATFYFTLEAMDSNSKGG